MICLPFSVVMIILLIILIIAVIDIIVNRGKEHLMMEFPYHDVKIMGDGIFQFFASKGMRCEIVGGRMVASEGLWWFTGARTFEFELREKDGGCSMEAWFYLRGLFPKYFRFTRYGYPAIVPRRKGLRIRNELMTYLKRYEESRVEIYR